MGEDIRESGPCGKVTNWALTAHERFSQGNTSRFCERSWR
jgi:hypothetical protein